MNNGSTEKKLFDNSSLGISETWVEKNGEGIHGRKDNFRKFFAACDGPGCSVTTGSPVARERSNQWSILLLLVSIDDSCLSYLTGGTDAAINFV